MARVTVEDCLENVDNRFELVMLASKRAHQLATGGRTPMVSEDSDKSTVVALREIAEGKLTEEVLAGVNEVLDEEFEEMTEEDRAILEARQQQQQDINPAEGNEEQA